MHIHLHSSESTSARVRCEQLHRLTNGSSLSMEFKYEQKTDTHLLRATEIAFL